MFGFYSGICVIKHYIGENKVTKTQMTKIGSIYVVFNLLVSFFIIKKWLIWMFLFVPLLILILLLSLMHISFERRFSNYFPLFLTDVIMRMKSGKGLRKSLFESGETAPEGYKSRIHFIYRNVAFSQQQNDKMMTLKSPFMGEVLSFLIKLDTDNHRQVKKLENFRSRLITMNYFRRKSGQIRSQVQLQAYLLLIIYAICFAFTVCNFEFAQISMVISISFVLFVAGFVGVQLIGRRIKWKI